MTKLLLGFILLYGADAIEAQTAPIPELGLDVNGQRESTATPGWPLLIRVVVVSSNGQPVQVALQNGAWTQALRLAIVDQNQAPQNWPMQLIPPASSTVNLSDTSSAEADWMVAPADTAGFLAGTYSISATLDTTATAATGAWSGAVQSHIATVQLGAEPSSPTPEQDALKYLVQAAYAGLRGDTTGEQSALDTLIARQPDILEAYSQKAALLEAAGDLAGALSLTQQALQKFQAANPNATEPVPLVGQVEDLVTKIAQTCTSYTVAPLTVPVGASGGGGTISVTAASGCPWGASTSTSWLTLSGVSGSGNGSFTYTAAANNTASSRQGTITVAGQTVTLGQAGVTGCAFSISPGSANIASGSGTTGTSLTGSFTLTSTNCGATDTWTAVSDSLRLLITSSTTGNGATFATTIMFSQFTNSTTTVRTTHVAIAGQTFTVTQAGSTETQPQRVVRALYQTILGREPDSSGWAFWTGAGAPTDSTGHVLFNQMADGFYTSAEFRNSGWLALNLYQAITGALPNFAAWNSTVTQLRSQSLNALQLANNLAAQAGLGSDNTGFVRAVYQNGFGRPANTTELNSGVAALNAGQAKLDFLNTVIFPASAFTNSTNGMLVQTLYYTILVRDADAGGFNFWLSQLNPPNGQAGIYYLYNPQPPAPQYAFKLAVIGQAVPPNPNLLGFLGSPEFQGLIQ